MAWKRSSVRSRPGPPCFQQLTDLPTDRLVAFGSKFPKHFSEISVNFFPLHSEFSVNRVDGSLHALRDFLHIHVGRCGRTGMPEKSLNVLHRSLLLRQRRYRAPDHLEGPCRAKASQPKGREAVVEYTRICWHAARRPTNTFMCLPATRAFSSRMS